MSPKPPSDPPLTRSEEKRAQIIMAAASLFVKSGYGAVSMDAIAAEANVSKRTVYSHFDDKASLFIAVMDQHCANIGGEPILYDAGPETVAVKDEVISSSDQSPTSVLNAFSNRFLKILLTTNTNRLFRVVVGEAERFPEIANSFNENGPKPLIRRLSTYLASQTEAGLMDVPDPERASWQLLAMIKEPWHFYLSLSLIEPPSHSEIEEHVAVTVKRFLRAYAPD